MKLKHILVLPAFLWMLSASAIPVFDISNFLQNTTTAAKAVAMEIHQAKMLVAQLESFKRNVTTVQGLAQLAGVEKELELFKNLKSIDTELQGVLSTSTNLQQQTLSTYGASGLSFSQFLQQRNTIGESRAQALNKQYQVIDQQMTDVATRRKQVVNQLQASEGNVQALQSVGAIIDTLIGQNQAMLQMTRADSMTRLSREQDTDAARKKGIEIFNQHQKRLNDAGKELQ